MRVHRCNLLTVYHEMRLAQVANDIDNNKTKRG